MICKHLLRGGFFVSFDSCTLQYREVYYTACGVRRASDTQQVTCALRYPTTFTCRVAGDLCFFLLVSACYFSLAQMSSNPWPRSRGPENGIIVCFRVKECVHAQCTRADQKNTHKLQVIIIIYLVVISSLCQRVPVVFGDVPMGFLLR